MDTQGPEVFCNKENSNKIIRQILLELAEDILNSLFDSIHQNILSYYDGKIDALTVINNIGNNIQSVENLFGEETKQEQIETEELGDKLILHISGVIKELDNGTLNTIRAYELLKRTYYNALEFQKKPTTEERGVVKKITFSA